MAAQSGAASFSKAVAARALLPASASSITSLLALRALSSDCFALAISALPWSVISSFSSFSMAPLYCCRASSIFLLSSRRDAGSDCRIMVSMLETMEVTFLALSLASFILA